MSHRFEHDPTAPEQLLQRYQGNWYQRLAVGLSLRSTFEAVDGCLMLCKGSGKWLQYQWHESLTVDVPNSLKNECCRLTESGPIELAEFQQIQADLCEVFSVAAERAIAKSGKAADRLLTIGVHDPGVWNQEFDSRPNHVCFCRAEQLAESSGLTIVDSFPDRDLSSGGKGRPVDLLALWLLLADRRDPIASQNRIVVRGEKNLIEVVGLPPSDGLDEEIPTIVHQAVDLSANCQGSPEATIYEAILQIHQQLESAQLRRSADTIHSAGRSDEASHCGVFTFFSSDEIPRRMAEYLGQESDTFALQPAPQGLNHRSLPAVSAALMSLMNLDQLPSSLPWIHGCESPRTLGRITPGSATNWRQVILNMADFRPPAMKLRDAV